MLASKFPFSTPERKSSWQGITETWMTGRPNAASLWGTLIRQCITMPPKLDHSRLAKLSSPRLLAAQQRLDVIDKNVGLPRPTDRDVHFSSGLMKRRRRLPAPTACLSPALSGAMSALSAVKQCCVSTFPSQVTWRTNPWKQAINKRAVASASSVLGSSPEPLRVAPSGPVFFLGFPRHHEPQRRAADRAGSRPIAGH